MVIMRVDNSSGLSPCLLASSDCWQPSGCIFHSSNKPSELFEYQYHYSIVNLVPGICVCTVIGVKLQTLTLRNNAILVELKVVFVLLLCVVKLVCPALVIWNCSWLGLSCQCLFHSLNSIMCRSQRSFVSLILIFRRFDCYRHRYCCEPGI